MSPEGDKLDTHRGANVNDLTCRMQSSGLRINAENDDTARGLVLGQQPFARGIDAEVARGFASSGLVLQARELARFRLDGKNGDTVVAAI